VAGSAEELRRTRTSTVLPRAILILGGVLGLSLLPSCVSFVWSRQMDDRPMRDGALVGLEPGATRLEACLDRLGAPLYVWEYKGNGAALAWGHADHDTKRISISLPLERARPSFSYGDIDANVRGAVLLFDGDFVLEQVKEGYLRTIAGELRKKARPAPAESSEADASPDASPAPPPPGGGKNP